MLCNMDNKYKLSNYNYFIDYNSTNVLLFNGLSAFGFCMTKKEQVNLQPLLNNLSLFKEQYPSDFTHLYEAGYIIDADFSEIDFLKFKNRQTVFNNDYSLIINPTLECNFNCWYCYEKHPKGRMSLNTIKKIKRFINNLIVNEKIKSFNLSWFGGEPLLYFNEIVYPLSLYAKKKCKKHNVDFSCGITTNAFLVNKGMLPLLNEIELIDYQITLDGGKERHDKIRNANGKPSYASIISNINLLAKEVENSKINVRINYDDKTLESDDIFNILDDILSENRPRIIINMQRVWQSYNADNKSKNERMILFMKKANEMGFKMAYYGGGLTMACYYNCYTSRYNQANINFDGKVYKCTARDYSDLSNVMGTLDEKGCIIWDAKKLSSYLKNPTFDNDTCLKCKYLPLCLGDCPQHIYERKDTQNSVCKIQAREISVEEEIINYYNKTFL